MKSENEGALMLPTPTTNRLVESNHGNAPLAPMSRTAHKSVCKPTLTKKRNRTNQAPRSQQINLPIFQLHLDFSEDLLGIGRQDIGFFFSEG